MDKNGDPQSTLRISNQFNASSACEHCQGIVRDEPFCITLNTRVLYAYEIILDGCKLTPGDQILAARHERGLGRQAVRGKVNPQRRHPHARLGR
jgi:hypothetical protein